MSASHRSAVFPPERTAVPAARELVRAALRAWAPPAERAADAVLVTSELVTNAVMHAGTEIAVDCALDEAAGRLRIEVRDLLPMRQVGAHPPRRAGGSAAAAEEDGERGLLLTQSLADSWGVTYTRAAKTVWFELALAAAPEPAPEPVVPERAGHEEPHAERLYEDVARWVRLTTRADAAYVLVANDEDGIEVRAEDAAPRTARGGDGQAAPAARYRSVARVPLTAGGRRLGLLVAAARGADRFSSRDISRIQDAAGSLAPVLARERDTARRGYRSWLGFLAEAGDLLAGTLDERTVLALAAQLYVPRLATWCAVYLDDPAGHGRLAHVWHADERLIGPLREALAAAGDPGPARPRAPRPWPGLESIGPAGRAVCGPLVLEMRLACRDRRLGTILLGGPEGAGFRSEPVRLAEDLGDRVGQALLTARRYGEQEAASRVLQRSLLPARLPSVPGIDYDVVYSPAGRNAAAGGDFYDLFPAGPGRWRFMLGDVAGTGPEAAAVTGLARHTLRALAREGRTASGALDLLNETIIDDAWSRMLTVLHGELEPAAAGGARLSVAAAGHPLPLRLRPDGAVSPVGDSQILLGAVRDSEYRLDSVRLGRGDLVLCVTDGITERRHGGRLLDDDDGLARILAGCAGLPARAVTRRVQAAVREFTAAPPDDDMAIMALRVAPDP
ncbi:SpoIIE family protein phosphatase [Actinomadura sp. 21ATH]|uniref:SpoIIE family protein phosphatase n=1 Tax=Actinomadura sp. 21ATH TaxID=1735444 RepID=UPI0035C0F906